MAYTSNLNYKTELCRSWLAGQTCKYGPGCQYAHGQPELRKKAYCTTGLGGTSASLTSAAGVNMSMYGYGYGFSTPGITTTAQAITQHVFDPKKFKTVLCRHYETTGTCQMEISGANCKFAHGEEELRLYGGMPLMQNMQNGLSSIVEVAQQETPQSKAAKRTYPFDESTAEVGTHSTANASESENSVFGATLDYIHRELSQKGMSDKASELYSEVLSIVNKYSAIISNGDTKQHDGDGDA